MKSRLPFTRPVIYALLCVASLAFVTPFLWLLSSSLKPLEQAMALPPTLLPHSYYATLEGRRTEVTVDYTIQRPGIIADVVAGEQAGQRVFLTPPQALARAAELRGAHRVAAGWIHVTERAESAAVTATNPRWDIVAPEAVESKIQFRWKSWPRWVAVRSRGTAAGA